MKELWNSGYSGKCGVIAVGLIVLFIVFACSGIMYAATTASHNAAAPTQTTTETKSTPTHAATKQPTKAATKAVATHTTLVAAVATKAAPTKPPVIPTQAPTQPTGLNGNPWGYNLTQGNLIYSPPATFCDYFNCIASFWNGSGYVNQCVDGTYSKSGGIRGACSRHGGEAQPLYSH